MVSDRSSASQRAHKISFLTRYRIPFLFFAQAPYKIPLKAFKIPLPLSNGQIGRKTDVAVMGEKYSAATSCKGDITNPCSYQKVGAARKVILHCRSYPTHRQRYLREQHVHYGTNIDTSTFSYRCRIPTQDAEMRTWVDSQYKKIENWIAH